MGMGEAIRRCLRGYVRFGGRASRPEYWYFILFLILAQIGLGIVDTALFGSAENGDAGPLGSLFSLAMLPPTLAAGWRRMHDTGRSGLFLLYPLIVIVGIMSFAGMTGALDALTGDAPVAGLDGLFGIVLALSLVVLMISPLLVLWWLTRPSQPSANQWGPAPR